MSIISISKDIDKFIIHIGNMLSWLALFLVIIVCTSVFLRYILGISSLGFDELQWHIYSFGFMMGFSYCTASDTHIRNDLLYNNFSELTKHYIDLLSHLLVLLPFVLVILYHSWTFVLRAYVGSEGSIDPGGLQYRWIIKSVLLLAFALFGIAAITRSINITAKIIHIKKEL